MFCVNCGIKFDKGSFCPSCGTRVHKTEVVCKRCGQPMDENARFCSKCGLSIETSIDSNNAQKTKEKPQEIVSTQFIQAKCANCGANLDVDYSKNTAHCPSCGAIYIISSNVFPNTKKDRVKKNADFKIVEGELKEYKGSAKDVVIPDSVTVIGKRAFIGSSITSVSIPDSVRRIRENAFANCLNLKEIIIPSSVSYIHETAFLNDKNKMAR